MKNKLSKGLSLSANPEHLIKGAFSAVQHVFAGFGRKIDTFGNNTLRTKITDGNKFASPAPVILCLVHRIFWQRVPNLVNKFALLLHKCRFTQDSRNKSENDWCWGCGFSLVANKQKSVAVGNKVMDTRLPQPAGCGDKYDVSGFGSGLLRCARNDGASNGEGLHRPWCDKILGTGPSMTGGRGANSFGRSMIEMLGVLAIVAVLTVGGIAGYSKAMEKWKINKALDEYTMLIHGLLQNIDYIQNLDTKAGNEIWLLDYAEAVGLLPNNWHKQTGKITDDTFGNTLHIFARNNRLVFDIYLQGGSTPLCREFYINLIKPLHEVLYYGRQFGSNGSTFFGDLYCNDKNLPCLNTLTLSDIQETCKKCEKACYLGLEF